MLYDTTALIFLSTLSLRRATLSMSAAPLARRISIHALLAESDQYWATRARAAQLFLSTLSLRRATAVFSGFSGAKNISIHALLAESDGIPPPCARPTKDFYPRSPCGERLHWAINIQRPTAFLSTLSLRRATIFPPVETSSVKISIHALLAESDRQPRAQADRPPPFLSTLSLRRATNQSGHCAP